LFGSKWSSITVLLQILSPYGLLRALLNPTALINVANGRIRYVFCLNLTLACVLPLGFWFSARHGLAVFCLTELLLLAFVMILAWRPLHRSSFGLSQRDYLLAVSKPIILSLLMGTCVYGLSFFLPASWGPVPTLCVLIGAGICLHCLLLTKFDLPYLRHVIRLVKGAT
jgi:O-antigen/teichoic acid export membrane protein